MNKIITLLIKFLTKWNQKINSLLSSTQWLHYGILSTDSKMEQFCTYFGALSVSGKQPTYPSPDSTLTLTSQLGQNVGLAQGRCRWVVSHVSMTGFGVRGINFPYLSRVLVIVQGSLPSVLF